MEPNTPTLWKKVSHSCSTTCRDLSLISARRKRLDDEIIPVSVEKSNAETNNEKDDSAAHAIDLDLETKSTSYRGSDDKVWLKVHLGKLHCVQQVQQYFTSSSIPGLNYTCTSSDCTTCEGLTRHCGYYVLTVSSEISSTDDLPPVPDCKYGDTVTLELIKPKSRKFYVTEIAVIGKQGEISCDAGRIKGKLCSEL